MNSVDKPRGVSFTALTRRIRQCADHTEHFHRSGRAIFHFRRSLTIEKIRDNVLCAVYGARGQVLKRGLPLDEIEQSRQLWAAQLLLHGCLNQEKQGGLKRSFPRYAFQGREKRLSFAFEQAGKERILVAEILVERTDAYSGALGHCIRVVALEPFFFQNASSSLQDDGDGLR